MLVYNSIVWTLASEKWVGQANPWREMVATTLVGVR